MDGPVFIVLSLFDFLLLFFRYFCLFRAVGQGREFVFTHFQGGFKFGDPLDFFCLGINRHYGIRHQHKTYGTYKA